MNRPIRKILPTNEAERVWLEHFIDEYSDMHTKKEIAQKRKELIKRMWEYKNEQGEQFSMQKITGCLGYKHHSSVQFHLRNMGYDTEYDYLQSKR